MDKPRWRVGMFGLVVLASVAGLLFGVLAPGVAAHTGWLAGLFLRLIVMVVGPLLFCIVVGGIVGAGSLRTVGRLGLKALLYFEIVTTVVLVAAVAIGLLVPTGRGIGFVPGPDDARTIASYVHNASLLQQGGAIAQLVALVPTSPVDAFARGNTLQILFFAILTGCCLNRIGAAGTPLVRLVESLSALFAQMMRFIIALAPFGVFGAMAATTAAYGLGAIAHLLGFVALYCVLVAGFVVVVLGGLLRLCGVGPVHLLRYFREEIVITFATTSSDAVLPSVMARLEHLGVAREVVGLAVPAGYSFNLDALSIYLGLAVTFLAQATGTPLGTWQIVLLLATAMLASKGAHGVPGIAIVVLAATLSVVPSIPPASLVLLLSVDWFVGAVRSVGNLAGNCVACIVLATWEGRFDGRTAAEVLGRMQERGALPLGPHQRRGL